MLVDTKHLVSVTDVSRNASKIIRSAHDDDTTYVVMNGSTPTAVISSIDRVERLTQLEELEEDLRLMAVATIRMLTDTGERHDLDDVAAEFGIDLSEE